MLIKKQDLDALDYKMLSGLTQTELEDWVKLNKLSIYSGWLLPQMVAYFGNWTLVRGTDGRPDVLATLKQNCGTDPQPMVLWKLSRLTRSKILDLQAKNPEYGQLTPLILMGFKRYQNVPYEAWRGLPHLEHILEPKLYEALHHDDYSWCDLGSERLLELRNQGLLNKAGEKAGTLKPADSTWALTGVQATEIGHLPKLTQSILTQIWLAHPTKRTPYMILDFKNWDCMPDPLVTGEIFKPVGRPDRHVELKNKLKQPDTAELPWL